MLSPTDIDLESLLRQAITHHQAGRLPDAERLYRIVLTHQPSQPDAHHNLGVLAMQTGRVEEGLPHLKNLAENNFPGLCLRTKAIYYKEFTNSIGLIIISHLGKRGFLSSLFSI